MNTNTQSVSIFAQAECHLDEHRVITFGANEFLIFNIDQQQGLSVI
jgi:spore coat protein U-like protein